jgi:macrolide transport system ATP-binding/permease protein
MAAPEGGASAEGPVLALRDIEKHYDSGEVSVLALAGVSLEVPRGQFVAIIGASGSGKSTLMNVIGCLDRPTAGTYLLAGFDVSALDTDQRAVVRSELIGFVFQGFNLLARTTALENVEMPLAYLGVPSDERRERATRSLELVGLGERLHNTPSQLSGGQQQRVAIARALVTNPEVLLADEPTGNLDSRTTDEVLAMLQWLNRERGLTIVMVTHESDVAHCASRIVTMRDGLIISDEAVAEPRRAQAPAGAEPWKLDRAGAELRPIDPSAKAAPGGLAWLMAFRLALRSLVRAKLRASLTALGILIGIAAVVTTNALGVGAQEKMKAQMTSLGVNLLVVMPAGMRSGGVRSAQGTGVSLTDEDAEAIAREVPTVGAVAPVVGSNVQVVSGESNVSTRATGTTAAYFAVRSWGAASGALWSDEEVSAGVAACAIGETVRQGLFGSADPVGRELRVGAMPCTVVAVLARKGQSGLGQDNDDTVVMPISTFRAGINRMPNGQVNSIMVTARGPDMVRRAQDGITALLRQRHRIRPGAEDNFGVSNLSDLTSAFNEQTAIVSALLLVVASISLLVGGIGVMNIMLVSVTERTREIGIRLAIGARGRDILAQFLIEATTLAAIGGVAGLGVGVVASLLIGRLTDFSVGFSPDIAAVSMGVSGGIGVIFGFFPARSAARLDPIVALRRE